MLLLSTVGCTCQTRFVDVKAYQMRPKRAKSNAPKGNRVGQWLAHDGLLLLGIIGAESVLRLLLGVALKVASGLPYLACHTSCKEGRRIISVCLKLHFLIQT